MRIEDIQSLWAADAIIDETQLATESAKIPLLHSKYYKIFAEEATKLFKVDQDVKVMEKDKWLYYTGMMTDQELRERNWKPCNLHIIKTEIQRFIDSDRDIVNLRLKYAMLSERVSFLKSILGQITSRNFTIKNINDTRKFEAGS